MREIRIPLTKDRGFCRWDSTESANHASTKSTRQKGKRSKETLDIKKQTNTSFPPIFASNDSADDTWYKSQCISVYRANVVQYAE